METQPKFRVVLVEDHPMFREQLRQLINKEPGMSVCGEADNIRDAFRLIEANNPDVAIVDLSLKGAGGLVLLKNLKTQEINVPVLVLSIKAPPATGPGCPSTETANLSTECALGLAGGAAGSAGEDTGGVAAG